MRVRRVLVPLVLGLVAVALPAAAEPRANDPYADEQWALAAVKAPQAWARATGKRAVVAVVSTGVDAAHPDLKGAVVRGKTLVGYAPPTVDESGAGTALAGVVAGRRGNGRGIQGVAPDARVVPIRFSEHGFSAGEVPYSAGVESRLAEGVDEAVKQGAHVVLLGEAPWALYDALEAAFAPAGASASKLPAAIERARAKGLVVIVPAGDGPGAQCPLAASAAGAVCVVATDRRANPAAYSRREAVDGARTLAAPGGAGADVLARAFAEILVPDARRSEEDVLTLGSRQARSDTRAREERDYVYWSGTAVAAAHVAGVAALLHQQGYRGEQIIDRMIDTAADLGPAGFDPLYGQGMVDADAATRRR